MPVTTEEIISERILAVAIMVEVAVTMQVAAETIVVVVETIEVVAETTETTTVVSRKDINCILYIIEKG